MPADMPGLVHRPASKVPNAPPPSAARSALWSKQSDDVGFDQLQKFWSDLEPHARQELLRIDKHSLFEQARKHLYCSRCNGLLLEVFSQIVTYAKSVQLEGGAAAVTGSGVGLICDEPDEVMDPLVHSWGGLTASRDGTLTLMNCYLHVKSFWVLQKVFNSARARERERELLYPDACGGGGRGWISHGLANYGRTHGARETCALHTARLSCDTLVDFWSALGDETRFSLFRMKEEDFIERLMYRFDNKRFCRDCRKNVIREFKELKELKRMRRETRCTAWFCAADTAFQYEVAKDTIRAEWHQSFSVSVGTYHHFEWAVGSGEGKSDILAFEDVGMARDVQADGLDLNGIDVCYITLRACKIDGCYTDLTVKAHALKGKPCVHRQLVVGDGFVTIATVEGIRGFFDHAEEAEEEEDDDANDKDSNEFDSDGSRPQKHAKSPELAREFLLDAATVIFKGQVEKAFREGTARQNAHSLFVSLALNLLEERLHVACKEIITYEKQVMLLKEEEQEKREEEERRERRRAKEREKKQRRKERLRERERERERKDTESVSLSICGMLEELSESPQDKAPSMLDERGQCKVVVETMATTSTSLESADDQQLNRSINSRSQTVIPLDIDENLHARDANNSFILEQSRSSRRRLRFNQDRYSDHLFERSERSRSVEISENVVQSQLRFKANGYNNVGNRCSREITLKMSARNSPLRFNEKLVECVNSRTHGQHDGHSCNCNQSAGYRAKDSQFSYTIKSSHDLKATKSGELLSRLPHHKNRQSHRIYAIDTPTASYEKPMSSKSNLSSNILSKKQVWEPTDLRKKSPRNEMEATLMSSSLAVNLHGKIECNVMQKRGQNYPNHQTSDENCLPVDSNKDKNPGSSITADYVPTGCDASTLAKKSYYSKDDDEVDSLSASPTSSLNTACNSIVSSDSSTSSSSTRNAESSSISDSEEVSQQLERDMPACNHRDVHSSHNGKNSYREVSVSEGGTAGSPFNNFSTSEVSRDDPASDIHKVGIGQVLPWENFMLPMHDDSLHTAYVPFPTMGYHSQQMPSWSAAADNGMRASTQVHYLFPRPVAFNVPTFQSSGLYVRYSGRQPFPTPVLVENPPTMFQNAHKANTVKFNEQMKNQMAIGNQEVGLFDGSNFTPSKQSYPLTLSAEENDEKQGCARLQDDILPFSLFHYNDPVAVASGHGLDSSLPKNETMLDAESKPECLRQEIIGEEYSLFASSGRPRFSFF